MFNNYSLSLLDNMILSYKVKLRKEKAQNQSLDPLGFLGLDKPQDQDFYNMAFNNTINLSSSLQMSLNNLSEEEINTQTQYIINNMATADNFDILTTYEQWLKNEISDDIKQRAINDKDGLFNDYFLPLLIASGAYQEHEERGNLGGDLIEYIDGNEEVALYKYNNNFIIGLKGTNTLSDLMTDIKIAFKKDKINPAFIPYKYFKSVVGNLIEYIGDGFKAQGISPDFDFKDFLLDEYINDEIKDASENSIIGNLVINKLEEIFKQYPENQFILTGHSMGGTKSSIINKYYKQIKRAYAFNMGQSVTGWTHEPKENFKHYRIKGDYISRGTIQEPEGDLNNMLLFDAYKSPDKETNKKIKMFYNHSLERFYDPIFTDILRKKYLKTH